MIIRSVLAICNNGDRWELSKPTEECLSSACKSILDSLKTDFETINPALKLEKYVYSSPDGSNYLLYSCDYDVDDYNGDIFQPYYLAINQDIAHLGLRAHHYRFEDGELMEGFRDRNVDKLYPLCKDVVEGTTAGVPFTYIELNKKPQGKFVPIEKEKRKEPKEEVIKDEVAEGSVSVDETPKLSAPETKEVHGKIDPEPITQPDELNQAIEGLRLHLDGKILDKDAYPFLEAAKKTFETVSLLKGSPFLSDSIKDAFKERNLYLETSEIFVEDRDIFTSNSINSLLSKSLSLIDSLVNKHTHDDLESLLDKSSEIVFKPYDEMADVYNGFGVDEDSAKAFEFVSKIINKYRLSNKTQPSPYYPTYEAAGEAMNRAEAHLEDTSNIDKPKQLIPTRDIYAHAMNLSCDIFDNALFDSDVVDILEKNKEGMLNRPVAFENLIQLVLEKNISICDFLVNDISEDKCMRLDSLVETRLESLLSYLKHYNTK